MQEGDMLRALFEKQAELNRMIGVDTSALSDTEQQQWLLNYCRAITQEVAELTDSVPWKWWARYQTFDKQNARVEVVDLMHFIISAAQVLGMTADDVYALYVKKHEVNKTRQETGYAVKDESDNKAL